MQRRFVALLSACLLTGQALAASAEEPSPPPWFGGRLETDTFALTIPDDWVGVDVQDDLRAQAQALADRFDATTGRCGAACADAIQSWLQGEDETVRLLVQSLPTDWGDGPPYDVDTCRVMGPESRQDHPLSELAGIIWDVFAASPGIDVADLPRALARDHDDMYAFDIAASDAGKEGMVYLLGGAGDFAWIDLRGSSASRRPMALHRRYARVPGRRQADSLVRLRASRPGPGQKQRAGAPGHAADVGGWSTAEVLLLPGA